MNYTKVTVHAGRACYLNNRWGKSLTIQHGPGYDRKSIKVRFGKDERVTYRKLRAIIESHGFTIDGGWHNLSDSHVALLDRAK